ncbi:MAG: TolC family protein, partial [Bacteroidota bacterium]
MKIGKIAFRSGIQWFAMLAGLFFASSIMGQETWSLRKCIEYAKDNNLSIKQAQTGVALASLTDKQNKLARLPSLNGSSSAGMQFGRTIDPTTNSFNNERISFNSFGLNASAPIYSGGFINNSIKQGKLDVQAAEADVQTTFNTVAVGIASAYLQILMAEEQLEAAKARRNLSNRQLEQVEKLIQAGTLPANDRLDVLAQIARDEQTIIQAQNLIDVSMLNLKELMQLDPNTDIKLERPAVVVPADANPDAISFRETYASALSNQPQIKADEFRLQSAETDVDIAKSALLPTLTAFGGLDTRWSSASKIGVISGEEIVTQTVFIDNTPVTVGFPQDVYSFSNNPYFDQLNENFGQNIGLSLQVPIFNNGRNGINVQRSEVAILNAKLQSDLTKQQLKTDVLSALTNARSARLALAAAQKSVDAAQAAFGNAERRFTLGSINSLELTTALNNL